MQATLFLGTLRRLSFGLGSLFGRRHRAHAARPLPVERATAPSERRSVIAAFEGPLTQPPMHSQPQPLGVAKAAVVTRPAPLVSMPVAPVPVQPAAPDSSVSATAITAPMPLGFPAAPKAATPAPVRTAVAPAAPIAAPVAAPVVSVNPAPAKKMRSLEEVRADLARLRASAKERHAQIQAQAQAEAARIQIAFAPTDFLDFEAPKPEPVPSHETASSFAPTAFFDLASLKAAH